MEIVRALYGGYTIHVVGEISWFITFTAAAAYGEAAETYADTFKIRLKQLS